MNNKQSLPFINSSLPPLHPSPLLGASQNAAPDSLDDQEDARLKREIADASRDPRIALTVWSTTSSTYTYTSKSTDTATTFSLSYFCTVIGFNFPPAC